MSAASLRGKVAIVGIGQSPVGKVPGRSPLWLAADAARKAIADAGLAKFDIDGVLSSHAFASPFHRFSVAFSEYFGIQPTFSNTLQVSGATAATNTPPPGGGAVGDGKAPASLTGLVYEVRERNGHLEASLNFASATNGSENDPDGDRDSFTYTYTADGTKASLRLQFKPDKWDEYDLDYATGGYIRRASKRSSRRSRPNSKTPSAGTVKQRRSKSASTTCIRSCCG